MELEQITDFLSLGITTELAEGLAKQGITTPTRVQRESIPVICRKQDVIARSETGSGKTLAYLLPLFMNIDQGLRSTQAIIIAPTHELAAQVHKQVELLAANSGMDVRSGLMIGGAGIARQLEKLKKEKPQIVVGSAGRILDLIQRKKLSAHTVKTIVIDEADRMLDALNLDAIKAIIKTTLKERQLCLFSASMGKEAMDAAALLLKEDFVTIQGEEQAVLPKEIRHVYISCERREKTAYVRKLVHGLKAEKTIVFINNPENIEVTVEKLLFHDLKAAGLYGAIRKTERKAALDGFRMGKVQVLVASDIGARGLDIPDVSLVIQLDIPEEPSLYLHRAGRTGRGGKAGLVVSLATPYEERFIHKYERVFNIQFFKQDMSYGKLIDKKDKPAVGTQAGKTIQTSSEKEKKRFPYTDTGKGHAPKAAKPARRGTAAGSKGVPTKNRSKNKLPRS